MKPINNQKIILASQSPRRKQLLEKSGLDLIIHPSDVDEESIPFSDPVTYAKNLSRLKADHIKKRYPDNWIIGADTIVVVDDHILGKPDSKKDAKRMLALLSNREHKVFTAFTICCEKKDISLTKAIETAVIFKYLTPDEIE